MREPDVYFGSAQGGFLRWVPSKGTLEPLGKNSTGPVPEAGDGEDHAYKDVTVYVLREDGFVWEAYCTVPLEGAGEREWFESLVGAVETSVAMAESDAR